MKVGIIGAGTMGTTHAKGWLATDAELIGISAKNQASAQKLAQDCSTRAFDSFEALLDAVDIIDICVPTDLHKDMVLQAAAAGKHILCEKPIALNLTDAQMMIDACDKAGVRLFIGMVVRFFPQYQLAQSTVASGQLGNLGVIKLKRVAYPPVGDEAWFTKEERSGGMILDLMIHDFDYARWLAGNVKRVYAKSIQTNHPNVQADYALVTLGFDDGKMALIEGGWAYPEGNFRIAIDIAGSDGLIEWNNDTSQTLIPRLKHVQGNKVARVAVPSSANAEDPYTTEIKHAYDAIKHNKPFLVSAQDGLEALRIGLAAKESLQTGQPVFLGGN